jgi:pimeloyl-ACP methyl ester carboxylesterase
MPQIEGAGVALHYVERGDGQPLLIVHAMASDAAAWSPALDALATAGARAIAYDRRGYGDSGAPQPYAATTVQEQAEDAAALLTALDAAPALLVGDGFGALVVLELLVRRPQLASAAVLVDPPVLAFVPAAMSALAAERSLLEEGLRDGGPSAAIAAWLGDRAGTDRLVRAQASQQGFFADYAGQASWSPARRELRAIRTPVAIVTGPGSSEVAVAAADALQALLPDVRRSSDGDAVAAASALLA